MDKFNNQFATQKLRQEMSVTGTGASFTPGTGEQMATNKAFKKKPKKEEKDVEPKLAAGKAKVYPKEKWGWKDAPSIPNRPSKGGFIYKQLFEELSYVAFNHYRSMLNDAYGDLVRNNDPGAKVVGSAYDSLDIKDNPESISKLDAAKDIIVNSKLVPQQKNTYLQAIDKIKEYLVQNSQEDVYEPEEQDDDEDRYDWFTNTYTEDLNENYSKFKNETKTRGKSDQFHQAVREVRKKVLEINRLFEYVSRLKSELSEGEGGLKYKVHTEKALAKIKEMVAELNQNIKKFK